MIRVTVPLGGIRFAGQVADAVVAIALVVQTDAAQVTLAPILTVAEAAAQHPA